MDKKIAEWQHDIVTTIEKIISAFTNIVDIKNERIGQLQKENTELKAQLEEIEKYFESTGDGCQFCKHLPCVVDGKSKFKQGGCHFEWRGTKEVEDGTTVD